MYMCMPINGEKYGFPKQIKEIPEKFTVMRAWLTLNGYPENEITDDIQIEFTEIEETK